MKFKQGVSIQGVSPELVLGLMVAESVYQGVGCEMWVTSLLDGRHSRTSLHYAGRAADLRIRDIPVVDVARIVDYLKVSLTSDFDVVLERDHIHLEFQPRRK